MLYYSKELINKSKDHKRWAEELRHDRDHFAHTEAQLNSFLTNDAALLPTDAWREVDAVTMQVMRADGGSVYMDDLMPLAKTVDIGTLVHLSRMSGDAGVVKRSLSGQVAVPLDKVSYDFQGTPIPIFDAGYGREWREWKTLENANFDALLDDQEAVTWNLRQNIAAYMLDGDASIQVKTYPGYGIRTNPNSIAINLGTGAGGANINLVTATSDQIEAFINGTLGAVLDNNYLTGAKVNLYVSPEIGRAWDMPYSLSAGFKMGSIADAIMAGRRVGKIAVTHELTGNEFFGFVPDARYIRPLVGMAVGTTAIPRTKPRENYQFQVSGAMGLDIRTDVNGRGGVFYSVVVN